MAGPAGKPTRKGPMPMKGKMPMRGMPMRSDIGTAIQGKPQKAKPGKRK